MRAKNNYTEVQLVDAFRHGDEKAFSELFHLLYPVVCFYALRYTGDQASAEDIASESFVKIWQRKNDFSHFKVLRAYLYSTVRNASINWRIKNGRQRRHENNQALFSNTVENNREENIIRAEIFHDVHTAFAKLPPRCRQIISMIFFEGKNTRQVAEELNLSIGTVKTQKAWGFMLLRGRMVVVVIVLTMFVKYG
jgi:RNA polymerase sigma-70 factor (family 1)